MRAAPVALVVIATLAPWGAADARPKKKKASELVDISAARAQLKVLTDSDWYYVDALERALQGRPVNPAARACFEPEEPFAACAPLQAAQLAVDRRLLDCCRGLDETSLALPVAILRVVGVLYEPVTRLLGHLFQHQIHHRGQAHAMLAGTTVAPPQLDEFFCANEAHLRAEELAALGLTEAAIWGASHAARQRGHVDSSAP